MIASRAGDRLNMKKMETKGFPMALLWVSRSMVSLTELGRRANLGEMT